MIALKALIGGPPEICDPGEPLVRSIRISLWSKLTSGSGMKLRVVPSALSLILSGGIPGLIAVTPAAATMTDLGTFSATAMSEATAVNRGGDVVGGSNAQGQEHAFLLTQLVPAPRIYRPPA
jgi:hypothetical protein